MSESEAGHTPFSDLKDHDPKSIKEADDLKASSAEQGVLTDDLVARAAAERRVLLKIDLILVPICFLIYLVCFVDRSNIGNAAVAGLNRDLGLKGNDLNVSLTAFYLLYCFVEIPAQVIAKKIGPSIWVPSLTFAFGLMTMLTAWVQNYGGLVALRLFLGVVEGGVLPALSYVLSRFYKTEELVFRMSLFLSVLSFSGAFSGLLASGLLSVGSIGSVRSWRVIFLVEGWITMGVSAIAFVVFPSDPGSWRMLKPEERRIAVERLRGINVSTDKLSEPFSWKLFVRSFKSIHTATMCLLYILFYLPIQGGSLFLPTIIRGLDPTLSNVQVQLRAVPPFLTAWVVCLIVGFISWRTRRRIIYGQILALIGIAGYAMLIATNPTQKHVRYGATFVAIGAAYQQAALCIGLALNNVAPDTVRAITSGIIVGIGNLGAIIGTWTYLAKDAPEYRTGNSINLGANCGLFVVWSFLLWYNTRENRLREEGKRDHRLDGLTQEEIEELGSRHPRFRYSI